MCMKGGAVTGGGVPGVTTSPSVFSLAFTQTGQSVPDAAGLKGSVQEGARREFTTSNAQVALEKCVFLALLVCSDASAFSLFLCGQCSRYIFCQLSFSGGVVKVAATAGLNTSIFLPAVLPVVTPLAKRAMTHHLKGNCHSRE